MKTDEIFKNKPWSNQNEYFKLVNKYHLTGTDLEKAVKLDLKRKAIPYPMIRPSKQSTT